MRKNMKIPTIKEVFNQLKGQLTPAMKSAFIAVFFVGLISHFLVFVGDFPNHDGLNSMYSSQNMIASGRWFLSIACGISSYFTLPWIIGLLSLFYIALTAVLLVSILEIKQSFIGFLVGGLLVSFPALTATFAYMFTADGYMLSLFLAVLAVYVTKRFSSGFLLGAIFLACSLGGYQAYVSMAMLLSFHQVILLFLSEDTNLGQKIKKTGSYVTMGVLGMGIYLLVQKILQVIFQIELNQYQGIHDVTNTLQLGLLDKIGKVYFDFAAFTVAQRVFMTNWFVILLYGILGILCLFQFFKKHRHFLKKPVFYLLVVVSLILLPHIMNGILWISPNVNYHLIMRYHWILIPILMLAYLDQEKQALSQWVLLLCAFGIILNYTLVDNIAYGNLQKKYQKTYAYCLRLVDRMEQTQGYYQGIPVLMYGEVSEVEYPNTDITTKLTENIIGISGSFLFIGDQNYQDFMEHYLNVSINVVEDVETRLALYNSEEYQNLEIFPAADSMKVVDGILMIKTK